MHDSTQLNGHVTTELTAAASDSPLPPDCCSLQEHDRVTHFDLSIDGAVIVFGMATGIYLSCIWRDGNHVNKELSVNML